METRVFLVMLFVVCLILALAIKASRASNFGALNPAMVCPHCTSKGQVRTKQVTNKKGISGGKPGVELAKMYGVSDVRRSSEEDPPTQLSIKKT